MLLRRFLGVSGPLRRGLSTPSASRPPWAMIYHAILAESPAHRATFKLAEPPSASHLFVPAHLVDPGPRPDPNGDVMGLLGGGVVAASADGLLLLEFCDARATAPVVGKVGAAWARRIVGFNTDPDTTRFVCNPLSGELFRLPDIDGTKKSSSVQFLGLLTHSDRPQAPPDRFSVGQLIAGPRDASEGSSFGMRRFLSQTGEWEMLAGLPSPLPLPLARRKHANHDHDRVAFGGRVWWVDVTWGAITVDLLSDRPELRFVELPRGSVTAPVEVPLRTVGRYRRVGVSEGRLRYAEVSQKEPFVLSSFALDDDGVSWTLEHRVALGRLLQADGCYYPSYPMAEEDTPRIGVIDPLNSGIMYLTMGNYALAVDMVGGKVLGSSLLGESADPTMSFSGFLTPCVLPPWLGSSRIPSAGTLSSTKANLKSTTLSDILVRADMEKQN